MPQIERAVERCLAAHGGQNGIGALFGNDLFNRLPGDGLNVSDVCGGGVGHDRGRVAVDQNDFVTLFAQSFASLHARVVELTGLANDDGASANDEDAFEVGALWHVIWSPSG